MFNNRSKQQLPQDDVEIDSLKPYQDNPSDEEDLKTPSNTDIPLPSYEPMHDYLRRQNTRLMTTEESSTSSRPFSDTNNLPPFPPYTDEPFLINLGDPEVPPPSYDNLHQQHYYELQSLRGFFMNEEGESSAEEDDQDEDNGTQTEDLVKWVIVMLMISLMVAFIGSLFDWGRSPQKS